MTPDEYCQDKAARSGSSFYYSFLFLPPPRRRAITAMYAFCREVDDVVDETTDPAIAQTKLDWWCAEVDRLYAGQPTHPVTQALTPHVESFGIARERMQQVIDGMQMDLRQNRYLDYANLKTYCHLVAGVVGELAAGIFGDRCEQTMAYARQLGLALQLVNIIRWTTCRLPASRCPTSWRAGTAKASSRSCGFTPAARARLTAMRSLPFRPTSGRRNAPG
jgi:phytoene synthase